MNGNVFQLKGPGGYTPALTASAFPQTFFFDFKGLPAQIGNDFIYADRIRFRVSGPIHLVNDPGVGHTQLMPNRQQLANIVRQIRVYSPVLGEICPRKASYGTFLINHDERFNKRFKRDVPEQIRVPAGANETEIGVFVDFEICFERDYMISSDDTTPLATMFEGGQLEIDLAPSNAIPNSVANVAWTMGTGANAWTCRASIEYHHDSQLFIHVPTQARLYEQVLSAPSFELQNVGAPQGLDKVMSGSRLAIMSWLGAGALSLDEVPFLIDPCQFYTNAPAGSGVNFAQQGLQRIDIPWRDQRSIIDVQAFLHSFYSDIKRSSIVQQVNASTIATDEWIAGLTNCDLSGFPNMEDILAGGAGGLMAGDPLLNPALTLWPMIWPGSEQSKIADMQMVDGTLPFSADFGTSPSSRPYRWRTDEVCQWSPNGILDLMDDIKRPHVSRGGAYALVPKYDGARMSSDRVAAFLPQKVVLASALK